MKNISVHEFKEALEIGKNDDSFDFINVCESAEYDEKHIEGVRNVPVDTVGNNVAGFHGKKKVYIHCDRGHKSKEAIEKLKEAGVQAELINVEGGTEGWMEAGYPTKSVKQ
jgi:rhodanese-related sulfurtransferase